MGTALRTWPLLAPLLVAALGGAHPAFAQPEPARPVASSVAGTSHVGPSWAADLGPQGQAYLRAALRLASPSQRVDLHAGRLPIGTFYDLVATGVFGEAALRPASYMTVRRGLEGAGLLGEFDRLVRDLDPATRQRFLDGELTPRELLARQARARGAWQDAATPTSYARLVERLQASGELARFEAAVAALEPAEREALRARGLSPRRAFELIGAHEALRPDVVIVGGGMAGIATARRLEAEGRRVVVLEAGEQPGGRVRTDATTFSMPLDAGGAWIHNFFENPTGRIAERLGLELVRDVPETRLTFDGSRTLRPFDDARLETFEARLHEVAERARAEGRDISVAEAARGFRDPLMERLIANSHHGATDARDLSLRDRSLMTPEAEDRLVREGMGLIPEALARGLDLRTGVRVERVEWGGQPNEPARIHTSDGRVYEAARVVVTPSAPVVESIAFNPPLPAWKREALANLPMGRFGKVMIEFDRDVFTRVVPTGARIYDTTNPRGVVEYVIRPFGQDVVIALFGGELAEDMERMGRERATEYVKEKLARIFGEQVRPAARRAELTTWNTDPLTRGAFSAAAPGHFEAREAAGRPVGNRIFFAGEATAPPMWVATIAGAYLSGERAASEVSASLRGQSDPLAPYRRADGTVEWRRALGSRALHEAGGLAHFGLALFLKELAVVARTGDRLRIEEFFDSLTETDFYTHYGLFVLGARAGEVAYTRFLQRHVKPAFVNGVLKTNLALAVGIALPEIVGGRFEGRAFAISLASLGLSSAAVRAGVRSIAWVTSLDQARATGALARLGARGAALARLGGWFYTAVELAVILYVADEAAEAATEWLDERAARRALAEAGQAFLAATRDRGAGPAEVAAAARAYRDAWTAWRNRLYDPLMLEEARFAARLEKAAREAKLAADRRTAALARLEAHPALRTSVARRYGSVERYAESLVRADEERLARDLEAIGAAYTRARDEHLRRIYGEGRRGRDLLAGVPDLDWHLGGAPDPFGARTDAFARLGRERARARLADALGGGSLNRLETYEDEAVVLAAARDALRRAGRRAEADALDDALRSAARLRAADAALFEAPAPAPTPGLIRPLEEAAGGRRAG
ncbi:MAG: FAD-dependent oxidoreductase [Planctomycetes bacterium]|nr:FAD-dependent oxidoreductase [Planctomycetota bacterium]